MFVDVLSTIECECRAIFELQLISDFQGVDTLEEELVLKQSEVNSHLAQVFAPVSEFWTHQRSLVEKAANTRASLTGSLLELATSDIDSVADHFYPAYYLAHEAMRPGPLHKIEFQLTRYSMRAYLHGCLHELRSETELALAQHKQAMRFLGPIKAPQYRNLIQTTIAQVATT